MFLFTPAPAYRMHYSAVDAAVPIMPEYPPAGARIDYYLASPSGEVKLEILDAAGSVVRSYSSESRAAAGRRTRRRTARRRAAVGAADQGRHEPLRLGSALSPADRASGGDGEGGGFGGGGPLVAPGTFKARLTAGGVTKTEPFIVKIDPRIAKDGVTVADLAEQTKFALKVRDALAEARAASQTRVRQALDAKRGDQAKLQSVWERLIDEEPGRTRIRCSSISCRTSSREIGAGRSEGRRERVRAVQPADEGVDDAQGGCRSRPTLNERCAKPSAGTSFTAEGWPLTFARTASRSGVM